LQQPTAPKPGTIAAACATADVLGADVRAALIARYTAFLLAEYRRIFRTTDEAGQLDNVSRRFAWFRRVLTTHEGGLGRAFLEEWKVGWALLAGFVEITRFVCDSNSLRCAYRLLFKGRHGIIAV
jgi:vacuolar protein sorting-associated protein 53